MELFFLFIFLLPILLAALFDVIFLNHSKYGYLFSDLLTLKNVISLFSLVVIIVLFSIIWGIKGIRSDNLVKLLKD